MTLQLPALVAPDAELVFTAGLRAFLATRAEDYAQTVYVSNAKPTTDRPRTVVIRRDGGSQQGVFDYPRLGVRVWTDDERQGSDLARLVQAWFLALAPGDGVCVAVTSLSGPSPIADPGQFQKYLTLGAQMRCAPL